MRTSTAPQDVLDALDALLDNLDVTERAREQVNPSSLHEGSAPHPPPPEDPGNSSDSSGYSDPPAGTTKKKRRRGSRQKRKERDRARKALETAKVEREKEAARRRGDSRPEPSTVPPKPPGTGTSSKGKKAYKTRVRAEQRRAAHQETAASQPYERKHAESFFKRKLTVRTVNLTTFEVRYTTRRGGYVAPSHNLHKVYTVEELHAMGIEELSWNGRYVQGSHRPSSY